MYLILNTNVVFCVCVGGGGGVCWVVGGVWGVCVVCGVCVGVCGCVWGCVCVCALNKSIVTIIDKIKTEDCLCSIQK